MVNGLWSSIDGLEKAAGSSLAHNSLAQNAAQYRLARITEQQAEVARLGAELPLDQVHLPFLVRTDFGYEELAVLATALTEQLGVGS